MKKGFTLIELLVVIAIIGILASVVLVGFGNTRDQAKDTRIKAAMTQIRTHAEIFHMDPSNNTYDGMDADDDILTLLNDIDAQSPGSHAISTVTNNYCVVAQLNVTNYFCIDSTGKAVTQAGDACSSNLCP